MRKELKVEKDSEIGPTHAEESRRNLRLEALGASSFPRAEGGSNPVAQQLLEQIVSSENMHIAWKQVKANKGAAGVDGKDIDQTAKLLRDNWEKIKEQLLKGSYQPHPVLRVEIPKASGGIRKLGIPTVVDRLIQQAIYQVLSRLFDPGFSEHSYGFRPKRSAKDAVLQAKAYQCEGKRWVVDMDLKAFFDEVDHDILMGRVRRKVKDKRVNQLINRYLKAGFLSAEGKEATEKGAPQGAPLSPLLSNILLDDLDKELEERGHSFCRYADDCNIYIGSKRAGERVLKSISQYVEVKLKLKVNKEKSKVDRPWKRSFLGYSFSAHREPKIRVAAKSIKALKGKLRSLFREGRGRNIGRFIVEKLNPVLRGWINYFSLSEVKSFAKEVDGWIRRHLRCIQWRQWKRGKTRYKELEKRGLSEVRARASASNGRGAWWNAGASHMNEAFKKRYYDQLELVSLLGILLECRRI